MIRTSSRVPIALLIVVATVGNAVLLSWFGILPEWIRSVIPGAVTMKEMTAFGLIMCAFGALVTSETMISETAIEAQMRAGFGVAISFLIAIPALLTVMRLPVTLESDVAIMSVAPGLPSAGTAVGLVLHIAAINSPVHSFSRRGFALLVASLGAVGLLGYVLEYPALYWRAKGSSTAMAVHTAGCFVMLGCALLDTRTKRAIDDVR